MSLLLSQSLSAPRGSGQAVAAPARGLSQLREAPDNFFSGYSWALPRAHIADDSDKLPPRGMTRGARIVPRDDNRIGSTSCGNPISQRPQICKEFRQDDIGRSLCQARSGEPGSARSPDRPEPGTCDRIWPTAAGFDRGSDSSGPVARDQEQSTLPGRYLLRLEPTRPARGFATARAIPRKRSTTGLKVRFLRVRTPAGKGWTGKSTGRIAKA